MQSQAITPLSIIIVGGGVGGLAAATFLAQDGHDVTVLERNSGSYEGRTTGGLALFNNSTSIFRRRRLWTKLAEVSDIGDAPVHRRHSNGEVIARNRKLLSHAMFHRADLLKASYELAVETGVKVKFKSVITSTVDSPDGPMLKLADGMEMKADLIMGADGINSIVRQHIFPEIKPRLTPSAVMLVDVPRAIMEADSGAWELWNDEPYQIYFGPGRSVVGWRMTHREIYHLQVCDYEYGTGELYSAQDPPDAPFVSEVTDTSGLRQRWSDFDPRIRHIFDSLKSYTKWKIAELPPLSRFSSESGRIVLIGDAAHAVPPFAGQGANMSIEDGATLATLLSLVRSKAEITDAVRVYDRLRVDRLAGLREIIGINMATFSMKDGEQQEERDAGLTDAMNTKGNWKQYGNAERFKWLEEYDAEDQTRAAWVENGRQ